MGDEDLSSSNELLPKGQSKLTCRLVFALSAAVLGMFNFGYNTGVINAPQELISSFYNESYHIRYGRAAHPGLITFLWAFTVAIFAVGGMVGALLAGIWAERFGRKRGIIYNTASGILAALFMALGKPARSFEMVIIGRFLVGFSCGLSTGIVPMYNSEISPVLMRGAVGTMNQLAATLGILISQVLGLPQLLGTTENWPYLLGLCIAPSLLQLLMMPVNPESPRFLLLAKDQENEARKALKLLRGYDVIDHEISEMKAEQNQQSETQMSICQVLRSRSLRMPLLVGVVMHLSQQLSGINCIFYYSTSLFTNAGISPDVAKYLTLGVGGVMVVMTLVTVPLMDRVGRKSLHLAGLVGMFITSILFTIFFSLKDKVYSFKYVTVVFALLIVVFFALGPGSIPWMIVAELFAQSPRSAAISIATLVNWTANFVVGQTFPSLQQSLGPLVFIPFTVFLFIFSIFLFKFLPETKNKTIEEIGALFRRSRGQYQAPPEL